MATGVGCVPVATESSAIASHAKVIIAAAVSVTTASTDDPDANPVFMTFSVVE